MKSQVFKWSAVAFLLSVAIICAHFYNALNTKSEYPDTDETLGVQTPISPQPQTPRTEFPKLPLLSPVSDGFLQNFGGTGEDFVLYSLVLGDDIFVFGHTFSSDYDFLSHGLFVCRLSNLGVVEKVLEFENATFLSSSLTENGIILAFNTQNSTKIVFLSAELEETHSFIIPKLSTKCTFLLSPEYVFFLAENVGGISIFRLSLDGKEQISLSYSLDYFAGTVGFSYVFDRLIFLANQNTALSFYVFDKNLELISKKSFSYPHTICAQSAIPAFLNQDVGFAITAKCGENILFLGLTQSGITAFSRTLIKADESYLLRTESGDYLAFCKKETDSSATLLCSHGDIIEQNVLSLSGYFPKDFLYQSGSTILLLFDEKEKSGAIASLNSQNTLSFSYSFKDVEPVSLSFSQNGLLLSLNATASSTYFGSCYGKTDGFLLNLN